ncbi:hypothetical protein BH11PSE8_BH11PSE8_46510 [soil metagenome]
MDTTLWLIFIGCALALCATTGGGCHWWYGRKLQRMATQLEKADRAKEFSAQQTLQARRQIERLQKELASALQRLSALSPPSPVDRLAEALRAGDAAIPERSEGRRPLPVNGFADTEPMARPARASR